MKAEKAPATSDAVMLLAKTQVSFRSRMGHLALLLITAGMCVALTSLLATEQGLPARATAALAALLAINAAWTAYAAWVLAARRTLLFNHRVVAGWIALAATVVFAIGATVLAVATETAAAWPAAGLGFALVAVAAARLMHAKRDLKLLLLRRADLQARLLEMDR